MKIKFKVNKYLPNADTIATIAELPMATSNPELTETKVNYHRTEGRGITIVEEKEMEISRLKFVWSILMGASLRDIIKEHTGCEYTFDHLLLQDLER